MTLDGAQRVAPGMLLRRDVRVVMRDGVQLALNVFLPERDGPWPVLMSVTPYGKDRLPDWKRMLFMRLSRVRFGTLDCSRWTGFESPDPLYWTRAGYAVVQADVRGMHKSEGHASVLSDLDAQDYAELIEWAAGQPWSTGAVGLIGVSYLAMSQWRVAPLRPKGLAAIVPWEGVTDPLRELGYQDGVPETGFVGTWWKYRMRPGHNPRYPMAEDFPAERDRHPFDDEYWSAKRPALERIEAPALVCASWSDHGLHTRGSLEGFERIGSQQKWLYTHGRRKWETFYSEEARALQLRFLDRFVKGEANGWESEPRVRLEIRRNRASFAVRSEAAWPLQRVRYAPLFLDAKDNQLLAAPPVEEGRASYDPAGAGQCARFVHRFEAETELTGGMALKLWVSASEGDDLDLFVLLRKFDDRGREVFFFGYNGFDRDGVAKGWLRVSHREQDPARSRPGRPWHAHKSARPVAPGEVAAVEIEVLASSTLFEAGSSLMLEVGGHDLARYPAFAHRRTVNRGHHVVHTGGRFDSHLLASFVPSAS